MPSLTNLYSGFARASRYQRVPETTLTKALKPYNISLESLRGLSDSQLRRKAIESLFKKKGYKLP